MTRKIEALAQEIMHIRSEYKLIKMYNETELNAVKRFHEENRAQLILLKDQERFKNSHYEIDQKISGARNEIRKINVAISISKRKTAKNRSHIRHNSPRHNNLKRKPSNMSQDFEHSKIMEGVFACNSAQDLFEMFQLKELYYARTTILNQRSAIYSDKKTATLKPEEVESLDSRLQFINEVFASIDQAISKVQSCSFNLGLCA